MIPVRFLTDDEYEFAVWVGRLRQDEDDQKRLNTKFESNKNDKYKKNEIGALCELAFWKFMFPGRDWEPSAMKRIDVGEFQVRGTVPTDKAPLGECRLTIREGDRRDDPMALVIQYSPKIYVVRGWIIVSEGVKVGRMANPNGYGWAVWVEQSSLKEFTRRGR